MSITPFITLHKTAKQLIDFYQNVFSDFSIIDIKYHEPPNNKFILLAKIKILNQEILISDTLITHNWSITPGISFFFELHTIDELDDLASKLSLDGKFLMPPNNYGFSKWFCWIEDQFSVNWQLNVPEE